MKRERVIDLGELIKSFWKPSEEVATHEETGVVTVDLNDIDTKVWNEANSNIKNIEKIFITSESENQKESKHRKTQVTKSSIKDKENDGRQNYSQLQNKKDREIGESNFKIQDNLIFL